MRATAEKSATTTSSTISRSAAKPFFSPANQNSSSFFPAANQAPPAIQMKMEVNKPGDRFEQEADSMANKVMRMPSPLSESSSIPAAGNSATILRMPSSDDVKATKKDEEKLQREATGNATPIPTSAVQSSIQGKMAGGEPLGADIRRKMESRFNADFSKVRIHSDSESHNLNNQLAARAFTHQNHIFFSGSLYQPGTSAGQQLLAHELTHTIQQGHSIHRSAMVSTALSTPTLQRAFIDDPRDKLAEKANAVMGFRMLTLLLGFNPVNMKTVTRSAANFLRALIELIPGGNFITQALDNHGIINKVATWLETKILELGDIGGELIASIGRFIKSLNLSDISDIDGVIERGKKLFIDPINRLINFGSTVASEILKMVKDAVLKPLAAMAVGTKGYDLMRVIIGEDPISGEPYPPTAENLLGGFMKFIGQEEIWENIKKGNAISRAYAWFQKALSSLMSLVKSVPKRVIETLKSLSFTDIITVAGAFIKIGATFISIIGDFLSWGLNATWNLLEIIFDVVKPGLMDYIKRTGGALKGILKNPLPFLGNLIKAAKLGFMNFGDRFGQHLKAGLIDWLTGSLEGVYIPKALSLLELGKMALSVLGVTWPQIRGKIVRALGPAGEKVMQGLELAFDVIKALVTGGPGAAWELIKEKLTDLKDQVVSGIIDFVVDTVVKKAIPKLISMFIPGAGFITAIITIYDTVMVFVNKISKIIQVVTAFIDSIVVIASGNIAPAAAKVESILGNLLSLAISFLAGFLGLSKITDKIMAIIQKVRGTVDKALDAAINWVVSKAKAFVGTVKEGIKSILQWWKKKFATKFGDEAHTLQFDGEGQSAKFMLHSSPTKPSEFLHGKFKQQKKKHPDIEVGTSISETEKAEEQIEKIKINLPTEQTSDQTALSGDASKNADKQLGLLDAQIKVVSANIAVAAKEWKIKEGMEIVGPLGLTRGEFSPQDKIDIAKQHVKRFAQLKVEGATIPSEKIKSDGTFVEGAKLDRRHVVSSKDMIEHYENTLKTVTVPLAITMISQRSSIAEARTQVDKPGGVDQVKAAAKKRYNGFFSYVNNIFIGDASPNRKIGRAIDKAHPGFADSDNALNDHIARIKREWSFGTGFAISYVKSTTTVV
jgi:Domain of unknown function (DUF4157)